MQLKQRFSFFVGRYITMSFWLVFALLVITASLYFRLFHNLMTNWDDELYIVNNPYLKQLSVEHLTHIFSVYYAGNYHPLTLTFMAINYKLAGVQPWAYQLTSLILHLCNTWLVFVFVKRLLALIQHKALKSLVVPFITALLFGIHTFQVESVAWMSEQKNVLYTLFFISSLILYLQYIKNKLYKTYILSIVLFVLSLLSKGMAVPLSLCVISIDYFASRNLLSKKVICEKIPYLVLSLIFGYIAIIAQHSGGAIEDKSHFLWINQLTMAGYGFVQYFVKLCFPYHLSAFYPYPVNSGVILPYPYYACMVIVLVMLFVLFRFFRHNRTVMFGSLFFIANISIVIQLLPVGDAFMADRYVYIPSIGFFLIVGYCSAILWEKSRLTRNLTILFLTVYCSVLGIKTYQRVGVWKDSMTLWNDAIKHYPDNNDRAFQNIGNILFERGKYSQALENYNKILQIRPPDKKSFSKAYIGKARIKQALGDRDGAMADFNTSLKYMQSYDAYLDRAVIKIELDDTQGALYDLDKAEQFDPLGTGPYINKGGIFYQLGEYAEAVKNFNRVLQIDPQNHKAHIGMGQVKQAMNDMQGALVEFNKALSLAESYEGYLNRAVLKIELKDFTGAQEDLEKASLKDSLSAEVYINKGVIGLNTGDPLNALIEFSKAVDRSPDSYLVYLYRAIAKNSLSDYQGAIADLDVSVLMHPSADAFYYRGIAQRQLKQKAKGCADLNQSALMGNTAAEGEIKRGCE